MLARTERLDDERPVRPALREDRDGVDVRGEHGVEVRERAVQVLRLDELRGALVDEVRDVHAVDVGVQLEQLGELGGELAGADHSDRDHQ